MPFLQLRKHGPGTHRLRAGQRAMERRQAELRRDSQSMRKRLPN
jgi:hypothetical protein